jgi:hypothetical protein
MNIIKPAFADAQFIKTETKKVQLYLHHTAGSPTGLGVASYWASNGDRIATSYVITGNVKSTAKEKDGDIIECFDSKYWAYHLGLKQDLFTANKITYQSLDKISVGIEVCNWGQLTKQSDGTFKNYVGGVVPASEVTELATPFKGYKYFHSYTDKQIAALKELILFVCEKHGISKVYNEDIFRITTRALKGENGIFTHNSVRTDKVDMYPHPKLIEMLKSL